MQFKQIRKFVSVVFIIATGFTAKAWAGGEHLPGPRCDSIREATEVSGNPMVNYGYQYDGCVTTVTLNNDYGNNLPKEITANGTFCSSNQGAFSVTRVTTCKVACNGVSCDGPKSFKWDTVTTDIFMRYCKKNLWTNVRKTRETGLKSCELRERECSDGCFMNDLSSEGDPILTWVSRNFQVLEPVVRSLTDYHFTHPNFDQGDYDYFRRELQDDLDRQSPKKLNKSEYNRMLLNLGFKDSELLP